MSHNAPHSATKGIDAAAPAEAMRELYDSYFTSHDYKRRYPKPNPATLQFLLEEGQAASARSILDLGCGDGRYSVALLDMTTADITGCDISSGALAEFAAQLRGRTDAGRVTLVHDTVEALSRRRPKKRHDLSLLLFGVLSHAGDQAARVSMLKAVRDQTQPDGRLLLSVPSIWRRRPLELLQKLIRRAFNREQQDASVGDMTFSRVIDGHPQTFFYHLYSLNRLRHELELAGWVLESSQAESLLPEWLITQHSGMGRLDRLIRPLLPASLGYGIRVVARVKPHLNVTQSNVAEL